MGNFVLPLKESNLYMPGDFSMRAFDRRKRDRFLEPEDMVDPFERIGLDPYWEYKVSSSQNGLLIILELFIAVLLCLFNGPDITKRENGLHS